MRLLIALFVLSQLFVLLTVAKILLSEVVSESESRLSTQEREKRALKELSRRVELSEKEKFQFSEKLFPPYTVKSTIVKKNGGNF